VTTVQLRRYRLEPGGMAAAFETFPRVITEQVNGFVDDVLVR
jgi:hypothetical protein